MSPARLTGLACSRMDPMAEPRPSLLRTGVEGRITGREADSAATGRVRDRHDAHPKNLPRELTSFVGRQREVDEVRRLLGTTRLLTLTGLGGVGKTRLGLRIAGDLLDAYPDGVRMVELA